MSRCKLYTRYVFGTYVHIHVCTMYVYKMCMYQFCMLLKFWHHSTALWWFCVTLGIHIRLIQQRERRQPYVHTTVHMYVCVHMSIVYSPKLIGNWNIILLVDWKLLAFSRMGTWQAQMFPVGLVRAGIKWEMEKNICQPLFSVELYETASFIYK